MRCFHALKDGLSLVMISKVGEVVTPELEWCVWPCTSPPINPPPPQTPWVSSVQSLESQ